MGNWDHVEITCCTKGCGGLITFHRQEYDRLKRTHESFSCPYGHRQHFSGQTDDEKRIASLEGKLTWEKTKHGFTLNSLMALSRGMAVCPLGCGWKSRKFLQEANHSEWYVRRYMERVGSDLAEHLLLEHNATVGGLKLLEAGPPVES